MGTGEKYIKKYFHKFFAAAAFAVCFFVFSSHASAATQIYYSVGQNTSDHKTGTPTVTVSGNTATFSVAQTATNMGVGDVIDYDTDNKKCYISGKTSTNVWSCTSATGTAPTAANDVVVNSISHAFASLSLAEAGAPALLGGSDLTTLDVQLNFPCYYDSGADTTAVSIDGYTTDATRYIKIYTPDDTTAEVNVSQRHDGKVGGAGFELAPTGNVNNISVSQSYTAIDGLKIKGNSNQGFKNAILMNMGFCNGCIIENNLIYNWGLSNSSWNSAIYNGGGVNSFKDGVVRNNIVIAISGIGARAHGGISITCPYDDDYKVYNNSVYGFNNVGNFGIKVGGDATHLKGDVQNNIAIGNATDFITTYSANADYNLSSDASASGVHSLTSKSLADIDFVSTASGAEDLHIQNTSVAKGAGANLFATFSTDIDNQIRGLSWDIGADQVTPAQVFYSVGQSTADLKTGSPTVTITAGIATFSVAQTGNIGVGDRVTYNTNQIAYISAKTHSDGMHWSLITATGSIPADITTSTVVSIKHEYTTLNSAIAGASDANHINNTDLTAANVVLNIPCYYDSGADTTAVTVSGYTTGANNFIKIYAPVSTSTEANNSQRHQGKWDDGKYNLKIARATEGSVEVRNANVWIDGLQVETQGLGAYHSPAIRRYNYDVSGFFQVSNNILRANVNQSVSADSLTGIVVQSVAGQTVRIWNNTIYNFKRNSGNGGGIEVSYPNSYVYNNTIYDSDRGLHSGSNNTMTAKNNLIVNCTTAATGSTFAAGTDYNATNNPVMNYVVSGGGNTHDRISQAISFADATNKDFHLSPSDTAAKNAGADLSADANLPVTTDIDGQTRPTGANANDIGADEAATAIYYSVGQNTSDHKTGTPTVDITSGTATFSVAQTATNMGVGDKVTYNTSSVAYISEKISTTQWKLITATGATPANVTGQTVNSIAHTFNSLSAAVTGASGAAYLNTSDLVAGNYQLNFPCYYDSGGDTTRVYVQNYTTAPSNNIKIYTPNNTTTEVNQSQRHNGKSGNNFKMLNTGNQFRTYVNYTHVDGIEFSEISNVNIAVYPIGSKGFKLSNCLIHGYQSGVYLDTNNFEASVWNNIFYDNTGHNINTLVLSGVKLSVYNNTIYGGVRGINTPSLTGSVYIHNNVANGQSQIGYNVGTPTGSSNNISQDATSPNSGATDCGGHSCRNQIVSFVDAANKDFHLSSNDIAAKNCGANLQSDPHLHFSQDIDGQERTGIWDIGADEFDAGTIGSPATSTGSITDGLIGYWSFDGPSINSGQARDISGNNNHGTINGATVTPGKIGQGMGFDGVGSDIMIDNYASTYLDFAQGTYSFWYKSNLNSGYSGYPRLISYENSGDLLSCYFEEPTILRCRHQSDWGNNYTIQQTVTNATIDRAWHHVVYSWDVSGGSRTMALAVDGAEVTNALAITDATLASSYLHIGNNGANYFNGAIDDVRIYNRALSADEVSRLYLTGQTKMQTSQNNKSTDGLVGLWSFDGPDVNMSTNAAFDRSGQNNNGTISGATPTPGKIGQGMNFDGVDDYAFIPGSASTNMTGPFTAAAWVYASDLNDINGIFGKWGGQNTYRQWNLIMDTSGRFQVSLCLSAATYYWQSGSYSAGRWYHVAVVYDSFAVNLYVDGVAVSLTQTGGSGVPASLNSRPTQRMSIGAIDDYPLPTIYKYHKGKLDDVRIYNRALSAEEVGNLYRIGQVKVRK